MASPSFSELSLQPALTDNLDSLGYLEMTPVQALTLPTILEGRDVIGQARTGSGKTAAFGLGLLQSLDVKRFRIQSLILCPTRELADQVASEIRRLARAVHNIKVLTLCGGVPFGPQKGSLIHGAHIIVGTPGRVEEHLRKGNLDVSDLNTLVLDEADRMLDMGFSEVLKVIVQKLPRKRQTLLFSATFPNNFEKLAASVTRNPRRITVEDHESPGRIRQCAYRVTSKNGRTDALVNILLHHQPVSTLVFCNTRQLTEEVATALVEKGFSAIALHGDYLQRDRDSRLMRFANRSVSVLVATDVAARGLDIDQLDLVVNYHLPRDPEVYTHRIGRTGRAGTDGLACSLCLMHEDDMIDLLENESGHVIERTGTPRPPEGAKPPQPPRVTLQIDGGRKQKIRAGDILGALTGDGGVAGAAVGKISIQDLSAFVAVDRSVSRQALDLLKNGKIKGRSFRARLIKKMA